jgi:hypothetical protein
LAGPSVPLPITDGQPQGRIRDLYWIGAAGIACTALNNLRTIFFKDTLFLQLYWFGFYVTSYADGFRRRALVGSVLRLLFPRGLSAYVINGIAMFCLLACLLVLLRALVRLCSDTSSLRSRLFLFALAASTLTGVFSEVIGDMAQVAFTLFFAVNLLIGRRLRSEPLRLGLALATVAVCFFIHESTICYLLPALPFLLKPWPRPRDFVLPCVAYAVLLALTPHFSTMTAHPTYPAILADHRTLLQNPWAMVTMGYSMEAQRHIFLESKSYLATCLAGLSLLSLCCFLAFSRCFDRRNLERVLLAFTVIFLLSLPIFIVAQDWGRFLVYVFLMTLVCCGVWSRDVSALPSEAPRLVSRLADGLLAVSSPDLVQLGVAFVLLNSANPWMTHFYGLDALATKNLYLIAGIALLAWIDRRTARPAG